LIRGIATHAYLRGPAPFDIYGEWKVDESGNICSSMRIGSVVLAPRCQVWFKHGEQYFLSDSDTDRRARVLLRTVKQ
jgi:hypothetical protein